MSNKDNSTEYRFSGYRIDLRQRRVFDSGGKALRLSSRAFDTLLVLVENAGETVSKARLMDAVWPSLVVEENNLNQAISSLRKALGDTKTRSRYILTVPGKGYGFIAELERYESPPVPTAQHDSTAAPLPAASIATLPRRRLATLLPVLLLAVMALGGFIWLTQDAGLPGDTDAAATTTPISSSTDVLADTALEVIPDSVAVLPFANLNPDGENTLFALGLHDEVINQLTKIRSLNVIARNSVLTLVDQELPLPEIRRLLRVESVMTGTILFADSQARINLQLLDPTSGVSFWAGTYEADIGNLDAMLEIQSDIALHVAEALEAEIRQSEQALITSRPTESFEAYRYNLAARNAHYQQDYAMEWSLVKQALELDPNYVDAWLLFASLNTVLVGTPLPGMSSRDHFELGLQSAERSIELAPDNSQGYALKAVALGTSKDWEGVAEAVDTLLNMDTPLSELKYVSLLLLCLGDFDRAIEIYEANLVTEPLNLYGRGFLMAALEMAGRRDDAQREYLIGEELNPVWWGDTVNVFLALGRDDALRDIDDLVGISAELKALLHRVDEPEVVRSEVFAYLDKADKISAEALFYSALAAHIGELEVSVQLLRESLQDVWTGLHWYWLPLFDEARQLDSFKQLLNESGLVDYWNQHGWPKVCRPLEEGFSCDWTAY